MTIYNLLVEHADYVGGPFTALIPEGEQEVIVTVGIINDKEEEPNEKFNVIITPVGLPTSITPKDGRDLAEITIINDDCKYLIIVYMNFILATHNQITNIWDYNNQ